MNNANDLTLDILVIEDDEDSRESLKDILELVGHRVTLAPSGTAAFELAVLPLVDVVIMDRQLPDGVAEELVPDLVDRAPQADVVIVTGYADLDSTIAAFRVGVSDYIIKPINPDSLLSRLERLAEHRQTEYELRAERQFATTVLETAEAIVLVLDCEGRIRRFNRYFADLVGYTLDEVAGMDWFDHFIPHDEQDRIRDVFKRTLAENRTSGVINPVCQKSGSTRDIRWSNTTLKAEGQTIGVLAVGQDVTDLLETQRKLLQSERLAAIGQTMTGLAHESRNALQRLQNGVDLLRDDIGDNSMAMVDIDKIERAATDLRDLLEEVREYAAPIQLDLRRTRPSDIWHKAWHDVEGRRQGREVRLVESDTTTSPIKLDERRMRQVFVNLLENALDASSDPVTIRIAAVEEGEEVVIHFEDSGPGIPPEIIPRVFEAFFTTKSSGTGLGLAIVFRIIEAHGGKPMVGNTGSGTRFEFRLPRRSDSQGPA
ncbi:MAG: PAS domain S-box protein [Planctomycetales bacterium]|nr:PAS domain S-box protein [Planctomycetales bacterium]